MASQLLVTAWCDASGPPTGSQQTPALWLRALGRFPDTRREAAFLKLNNDENLLPCPRKLHIYILNKDNYFFPNFSYPPWF